MEDNNPKRAGRKPKYKSGSVFVSFRVPVNQKEHIRIVINKWLKKFE